MRKTIIIQPNIMTGSIIFKEIDIWIRDNIADIMGISKSKYKITVEISEVLLANSSNNRQVEK